VKPSQFKPALTSLPQAAQDKLKTPEAQGIIRAFKATISREMGKSGSSLFAHQVMPIATDVADALGYDVKIFLRQVGYRDNIIKSGLRKEK
jgi:hypothetical protein